MTPTSVQDAPAESIAAAPRSAPARREARSLTAVLLLASGLAGAALVLLWLLRDAGRGFDITDESYALLWMAQPFAYHISLSQFGYVYHPLYELLDGNVRALRTANVLGTYALGTALAYAVTSRLQRPLQLPATTRLGIAAALGTAALAPFTWNAATPNYNSLNLQGLMIAVAGLLAVFGSEGARVRAAGAVALGIGGWLVFMAKAPSAAGLALISLLAFAALRARRLRELAVTVGTAALLVAASALLIDGSFGAFASRIATEMEHQHILDAGHSLEAALRWDALALSGTGWLAFISVAVTVLLLSVLAPARSRLAQGAAVALGLAAVAVAALAGVRDVSGGLEEELQRRALLLAVPAAALLGMLAHGRRGAITTVSWRRWSFASVLLAMPHVLAFGTNNDYWFSAGAAGIFWVLAAVALVSPALGPRAASGLLLGSALATLVVMSVLLNHPREHPYRQVTPLGDMRQVTPIGTIDATLVTDGPTSRYLTALRTLTTQHGFQPGDRMIDLTGHSPGAMYVVGATPLGRPWLLGGYPGSDEAAAAYLAHESCRDLARAWVLLEPGGSRRIATDVLDGLGIDLGTQYRSTGVAWRPRMRDDAPMRRQRLFRPVRSADAQASCEARREAGRS